MSRQTPRFRRANPPLPVPLNNVYAVSLVGSIDQQETITTYYYQDQNARGTGQAPMALALRVAAIIAPAQAAVSASTWSANEVIVRMLTDATTPTTIFSLPAPIPGTVAGQADGTIAAATITRQTAFRGQTGRGHVNLPAVPATAVTADGTSLTAASMLSLGIYANTVFFTALVGGGNTFNPVLASRGTRTQMPKVVGSAPLVTFNIRQLLGTVRRRKIGRGK
jgi:hypothetical protein